MQTFCNFPAGGGVYIPVIRDTVKSGRTDAGMNCYGKIGVKKSLRHALMATAVVVAASCMYSQAGDAAGSPVLGTPDMPLEQRIDKILAQLTTEEKVALCYGRSWMEAGEVKRLGIGQLKMADGPQGVTRFTEPCALPVGISLSCTWNPEAAHEYGKVIAEEMLALKRHMILGPGVNLMRTPRCGRNFEYYGEEPYLSGTMAAAYIQGVQSLDVAACVKHFVANNQENHRCLSSSNVDERTLRELYMVPFEIAVKEGKPWSLMSSYNRLNGIHAAEHKWLQDDVLKKEWGFDGLVVSDWNAVVSAKGSALGGLDLEMGSGHFSKDSALLNLVKSGEVPMDVLDDKVRRMLRLMARTHVLDPELQKTGEVQTPAHQKKVRELASEGMVLLKNDRGVLPLDASKLKKVLVVGPNADKEHRGGGGSGGVNSPYEITPLQGIRQVLGDRVEYVAGLTFDNNSVFPSRYLRTVDDQEGLTGEYYDNPNLEGAPVVRGISKAIDCKWGKAMFGIPSDPKMPTNRLSVRWTGKLVAPVTGPMKLGVNADDGVRVWLDGKLIIDQWKPGIHNLLADVSLQKGREYDLKVEYNDVGGDAYAQLVWQDPRQNPDAAVAAAKDADAVIFVGGTHHGYDREGGWGESSTDIPNLELIGAQSELIEKLAKENKNIIVVLVNGSVVKLEPWIDHVPSVLEAWYGGQEAGNAIADILFGKVNPSGKLTCTFGKEEKDYACHAQGTYPGTLGPLSVDPHTDYKEGIFIGYRWFDQQGIEPRFPFGYGLSYTTFTIAPPSVSAREITAGDTLKVTTQVSNTGSREGAEVVQLYVSDPKASVPRPPKELKGFRKVFLKPGETKTVEFELAPRAFSFWDTEKHDWKAEPGEFEIRLGNSSRNLTPPVSVTMSR